MINLIDKASVQSPDNICINDNGLYLGLFTIEDFEIVYSKLNIDEKIITECHKNGTSKFESHLGFDFIKLILPTSKDSKDKQSKIFIYFSSNLLIFISNNNNILKKISSDFKSSDTNIITLEKVLYAFLEKLTSEDSLMLEKLEQHISDLEEMLITSSNYDNYINEIITLRRRLLSLKRYYEQLIAIGESIEENENELISEKQLKYFKMFTHRMNRLFNSVINLRDYVTQVREAYQAQVDINQNNLMKIFTLITTIFFPLTLIVGWYGMNFQMPEYGWKYGYPIVITLSISIIVICIFLFRKKKWF